MKSVLWIFAAMLGAGVASAADRVEIVVDVSASMWSPLQDGAPQVVAVREALEDFAVWLGTTRNPPDIGLRSIAGTKDRWEESSCSETAVLVPIGPAEHAAWREATANLEPKGARGLVGAVTAAIADLGPETNRRRVVVITSGEDECNGLTKEISEALGEGEQAVEARVIGLALSGTAAADLAALATTRIVTDRKGLAEALRWAVLPATARPPGNRPFELHLSDPTGGEWSEVRIENQASGRIESVDLENAIARTRLPPGLYRATLEEVSGPSLAVAGLSVGAKGGLFEFGRPEAPPATLEAVPDQPTAGGTVFVHYWGVPPGSTWVTLAPRGSPFGAYLLRQPAPAGEGEVAFRLPGELLEFEARCVHEASGGALSLCGRTAFECQLEIAHLQAPERAENRTPMTIEWTGPDLPGDRITIGPADGEDSGWSACLFTRGGNPLRLAAPVVPGNYWIRYVSSGERVLARSTLEVYEILAVLEGPKEVAPGKEFVVGWEGPGGDQDYVAISAADAPSDEYLSFSPTATGPSVQLRAPDREGEYELRYVRSSDGKVLAREEISVVATTISLRAPKTVEAGKRFTVEWSGTAGEGDFVTVAPEGSAARRHLDFSFTSEGSSLSLAAPFRPGRYEVRYISASEQEVLARIPLVVQ